MAVVYQEDEDNQGQGEDQANPLAPQGGSVGGSSNAMTGEVQKTSGDTPEISSGAKSAPKSASSGRFVNIENYLKANQGNQVGQAVAGKVSGQADVAQQAIGSAQSQFQQQAKSAAPTLDSGTAEQAAAIAANKQASEQQAAEVASKLAAAQKAEYTGPTALADEQGLITKAQELQKLGELGKTEGGRFELLRSQLGKPTYTTGQQKLDNLFLVRDQGGVQALKDIEQKTGATAAQLKAAQEEATGLVIKGQQAASDVRGQATGLAKGAAEALKGSLEQRAAQANAQRAAEQAAAKSDTNFIKSQLDALGINPGVQAVLANDPKLLAKLGERFSGITGQDASLTNVDPETARAYNQFASLIGEQGLSPQEQMQAAQRTFNTEGASNLLKSLALPDAPVSDPNGPIVSNTAWLPDQNYAAYTEALNNAVYSLLGVERPKPVYTPPSAPTQQRFNDISELFGPRAIPGF